MKTRMKNQLVNKKGLTLIQTLVVVAIVVILLGVAFIGIQGLVDRINQTKLDNVAQSMYVSAQNRIRELKASGEIDRLFTVTAAELGDVVGKPVDWDLDDGDTVNHEFLKYFYHNKNNSPASTSSDLVDFFFPKGSIDGNVLDNNWVIELDPVTGYVYSAFYSETRLADDYYVNNNSTLDTTLDPDETSSIRFKEFRHGLKGNNKVGYYGGKTNIPAYANVDTINASLNIINADILKAKMTAIIPSVWDTGNLLEFKLTVTGKTSNNTVTLMPPVSYQLEGTTTVFSASVILDNLDDDPNVNQQFKNTFGDIAWASEYIESKTGALIPGEDLELSFTVSSNDNDDRIPNVGPINRTVNSLFASLTNNPDESKEANIAYGRHLQNLDTSTSGLQVTITSAKQISDIDFNDDSDQLLPNEEPFLWKSLYSINEEKTFTPIYNESLLKYSGYIPSLEPNSFKILNMHIDDRGAESAGLFKSFKGNEISGVTMVNEKIDGGTNVGGLAGTCTSNLIIENCRLYIEEDYFETESTYVDNIFFKGTFNVGGFIGSSPETNILKIQDSFASTIIEGGKPLTGPVKIGGLIGSKTNGSAQIQDSYADSYLIGGVSTSQIGGLAGQLTAESSISGSYSAGFGIMKGGLTGDKIAGFVPSGISSVTNSYSIFNSSESNATHIYSTVLSAEIVENVYYFGSGDTILDGSLEYEFTSNAAAVAVFTESKFSPDDDKLDTYPYNQKAGLELVKYPYVSIIGLPHYGDWEKPPKPQEKPDFGTAGLFYWERVEDGSDPGYQIYMVGRKGDPGNYEAVFHDTTIVAHDDGGIVKEYGYGYFVEEIDKDKLTVQWLGQVNVSGTNPIATNTLADGYFNNHEDYEGYEFHCYTTCDEANPATSYNTGDENENNKKYMFMLANVQNAKVVLHLTGADSLRYTFCPFFAKSIMLEGWDDLDWNYDDPQPDLQNEPGTVDNSYRIRSLDQLQFINWNSLSKTNDRMTNNETDKPLLFGGKYYCKNFPYLMSANLPGLIIQNLGNYWYYSPLQPLDGLLDFTELRKKLNFVQDYDIECIGRTGYSPIAALGETSGSLELTYRIPFFAWFGGSFDGQSYKIKNLSITSGCYSVGVFGLTVSATIENVVLIRDSEDIVPVIERPKGSPEGYYAIGTLVGMANEYCIGTYDANGESPYDYVGKIENCAVAGYEIIDESDQPVSCGETTIGGLAGVLRTNINKCSAVTTIRIKTNKDRGTSVVGVGVVYKDNITVGGIAGTSQTRIYNCYSGGKIIVDPSLFYTNPNANGEYMLNIYISGIASSAFTCRAVNMHDRDDESWAFVSPKYYNCYSYMRLPQPKGNVKVAVIGGDAYYSEVRDLLIKPKPVIGGELNNCHYYTHNYIAGQMIISNGPDWVDNGIYSKSYDEMSHEQFCIDLNNSASQAPYHQATYSFPCGDASLEGENYPFAAVITQKHKNAPSDPDDIYVHYGEWPKPISYTGKLILKHHDGTNNYIDNSYIYKNGDDGIDPELISEDTHKPFSALNDDMSAKGLSISLSSTFDGWYVNHEGTRKKLLNTDGSIYTGAGDIAGITQDGIFNVNLDAYPEGDIELYAMWKISYNPLIFVTDLEPPLSTASEKYLIIAGVLREKGTDQEYYEYYCMGGDPPVWNQQVAVIDVDLQNPKQGVYYLTSPVSNDTMLWDVVESKNNKKYLKLFNNATATYINRKNLTGNADSDAVFCNATWAIEEIYYNSDTHNLYFQANWRILFDDTNTNKKFYFNKSNQGTIPTQDGGIWLFKCSTNTEVRLHEFK